MGVPPSESGGLQVNEQETLNTSVTMGADGAPGKSDGNEGYNSIEV